MDVNPIHLNRIRLISPDDEDISNYPCQLCGNVIDSSEMVLQMRVNLYAGDVDATRYIHINCVFALSEFSKRVFDDTVNASLQQLDEIDAVLNESIQHLH